MEPDARPFTEASPFRIWHFVAVFLAALVVGVIGYSIGLSVRGEDVDDPSWGATVGSAIGQFGTYAVALVWLSRSRGTGSLRRDYGLELRLRDWWCVPAGSAMLIGAGLVLLPLTRLVDDEQEVVEDIRDATGAEVAVLVVIAVLLAPLFEELLFRGLFLRSLLARMDQNYAIGVCGAVFALVHALDFSMGTIVRLPALAAIGWTCAYLAVRHRSLSPAILFHIGFNALSVAALVLGD